ncbi:uncharacterized protein LOC135833768 [Planococcus citri]|uniref:uncharacterized protein LOC135833768 n=1 Tax=Planococcus citri TaxID=170843 RepID=UPI0031F93DD8
MELKDTSYKNLLDHMQTFSSKVKKLKKERDDLKSSLKRANYKIVDLEATVIMYKAKYLEIVKENQNFSQIINTLHEELTAEGPLSNKINEVEQDVSRLSEAIDNLTCNFEKTNSATDASPGCEKLTQDSNDVGVLIQDDKNKQPNTFVIDSNTMEVSGIGYDEFSSTHFDEESPKSSLSQPILTQSSENEDVNDTERSNISSSYSSKSFPIAKNLQNESTSPSMSKSTPEKSGDIDGIMNLIASSSQSNDHKESYSFSNTESASSAVERSPNFTIQSGHSITKAALTSEEIFIGSIRNKSNSFSSSDNESDNVVGSNKELMTGTAGNPAGDQSQIINTPIAFDSFQTFNKKLADVENGLFEQDSNFNGDQASELAIPRKTQKLDSTEVIQSSEEFDSPILKIRRNSFPSYFCDPGRSDHCYAKSTFHQEK